MAAPRRDDVKSVILDAAERLMLTTPLASVSLAKIAAEAGVSKGTLYYHYKTKEDIFFDLTDRYLKRQWAELVAWTTDESKDTSMPRLARYVAQRNVTNEHLRMHLLYGASHGDEALKEKLNERYAAFAGLLADAIGERVTTLPADYLAWLVLLACDGLIVQKSLGGSLDAETFIERSAELMAKLK